MKAKKISVDALAFFTMAINQIKKSDTRYTLIAKTADYEVELAHFKDVDSAYHARTKLRAMRPTFADKEMTFSVWDIKKEKVVPYHKYKAGLYK